MTGSLDSQEEVQSQCPILCNTCGTTASPTAPTNSPTRPPAYACLGSHGPGDESNDPAFCSRFHRDDCEGDDDLAVSLRTNCRVLCQTCPTPAPTLSPISPTAAPSTGVPSRPPTEVGDNLYGSLDVYDAIYSSTQTVSEYINIAAVFCDRVKDQSQCMLPSQSCIDIANEIQTVPRLWVADGNPICRHVCQRTCERATPAPTTLAPTFAPTATPTASAPPTLSAPSQSPTISPDVTCTDVGGTGSRNLYLTVEQAACNHHVEHIQQASMTCTGQQISLACQVVPNSGKGMLYRDDTGCGDAPINKIVARVGYQAIGTRDVRCDTNGFFTVDAAGCSNVANILNNAIHLAATDGLDGCNFTTPSTTATSTLSSTATTTHSATATSTQTTTATTSLSTTASTSATSTGSSTQTSSMSTTASTSPATSASSSATTTFSSTVTTTATTAYFGRVQCAGANSDVVFATSVGGRPGGGSACGGGGNDTARLLSIALRTCSGSSSMSVVCKAVDTDSGRVELLTTNSDSACLGVVAAFSTDGGTGLLVDHTGSELEPVQCGSFGTLRMDDQQSCRDVAFTMNAVVEYIDSLSSVDGLTCDDVTLHGALPTTTVTSTVTTTVVPEQLECDNVRGVPYMHIGPAYVSRCEDQAQALNAMINSCSGDVGTLSCASPISFDDGTEFFSFAGGNNPEDCDATVTSLNQIIGTHGFNPLGGTLLCDGTNTVRGTTSQNCNYDISILNEAFDSQSRRRFVGCGNRTSPSSTATSTATSSATTTATSTATTTGSNTGATTVSTTATTTLSSTATTSASTSPITTQSSTGSSTASSSASSTQTSSATTTGTTSAFYDGRLQCTQERGGETLYEVRFGACASVAGGLNSLLNKCGISGPNSILGCTSVLNTNGTSFDTLSVNPTSCGTTVAVLNEIVRQYGFRDENSGGITCALQGQLKHNVALTPCTYTRDMLVEILERNEQQRFVSCPSRASPSSTATSTATSSLTTTASSSLSTTLTTSASTSQSSSASTTVTSTVATTVTTSATSSASTTKGSTVTSTASSSATTSATSTASTSATTTVTTYNNPRIRCRSSAEESYQSPVGVFDGGRSPEVCQSHADTLNDVLNDCSSTSGVEYLVCADLNVNSTNSTRRNRRQQFRPTPAPTAAPSQVRLSVTNVLSISGDISAAEQPVVLTRLNRLITEVDTSGSCSERGNCSINLVSDRFLGGGTAADHCGLLAELMNSVIRAGRSGLIRSCDFSTATSTVTSTGSSTATSAEWSSLSSTATTTATSTASSSVTTTDTTTATTTATSTVTTQFDAALEFRCEPTESVLYNMLTINRHDTHCDMHANTMNALLAWCNPKDPDAPLEDEQSLQVTLGTRGNVSCTDSSDFNLATEQACERHAALLGSIVLRGYDTVNAALVCVNGTYLGVDADHCGSFARSLTDMTNKFRFNPQDEKVRSCSSAPVSTVPPRSDSDATYRFFFVRDSQFNSFLAGRFTMSSVTASLRLQLGTFTNIPVSRLEITGFTNMGAVDTIILERTRPSDSHSSDLLLLLDQAISTPFLFNYSGRTLTTVIPGSNTAAGESGADDSDPNTTMIVIVAILIGFVVVAGILLYRRDASKTNKAAPDTQDPVSMINIDGKPYWRDDTEDKKNGESNVEESVIDDMTNPRRTTLEYHNPVAYHAAGSVAQPEALGGFDYIVRSTRPVMPFTFSTAFPVAQLAHRTSDVQEREFNEVVSLSAGYKAASADYKFLDDYNLPRGLIVARSALPWDVVWQSECTMVVLMPSVDETGTLLPSSGESMQSDDIAVLNSSNTMLTETLSCSNLSLTNQLSGEERMVQALQLTSWDEASVEQDLIDLLIAAKQSHYLNECSPTVVFDASGATNRPSSGAFVLSWICVKSALDSGFIDLARTNLLLRAQEKELVRDSKEYQMVHATLMRMLLTIPSMAESQMSQAQQLTKVCLQTWHETMKAQLRGDVAGYMDVAAVPDVIPTAGGYLETVTSASPAAVATLPTPGASSSDAASFPDFPEPTASGPGVPAWRQHA